MTQQQRLRERIVAPDDLAVAGFDHLPDSARVRPGAAARLLSVSIPTLYRWTASGKLPKLRRIGGASSFSAGELRKVLKGEG